MVRVECMTYNHAPYIEDAMNGFCMQETDFPFVCVIVDDASTDGEPEVIKRYLKNNFDLQDDQCFREEDTDDYHLIFARHKTNLNCYLGVLFLKYNHWGKKAKAPYYEEWSKAKYIAFCEGDDYWTDSQKLKKQISIMETHHEYGMIYTNFFAYDQKTQSTSVWKYSRQSDFNDMLIQNRVCTLTVIIRSFFINKYHEEISSVAKQRKWLMGDYPLWLFILAQSKGKYLPEKTGVYRVLERSASHFTVFVKHQRFIESSYDCSLFFAEKYNAPKELIKEIAKKEITHLFDLADNYESNFNFRFLHHMLRYNIFTPTQYANIKIRQFQRHIKIAYSNIRIKPAIRTRMKNLFTA